MEFVIGDIHGRLSALKQVLEYSNFDFKNDSLIILGDVVDGGLETKQVVDLLLKIEHSTLILGNHDVWFKDWYESNLEYALPAWVHQGGYATMASYDFKMPSWEHRNFFNKGIYYLLDSSNRLFVHGGINPFINLEQNPKDTLIWDRQLISYAKELTIEPYSKVFIGHTTTQYYGSEEPIHFNNLIMLDTGAGWDGRLTIMNIDSLEFFQSDNQQVMR